MSTSRKFIVLLCVLALAATAAWATGAGEAKKKLPPGPAFDSTATMPDEGTVKPVSKKAPKPIKIAVLGLENNPFWIPVKQGTIRRLRSSRRWAARSTGSMRAPSTRRTFSARRSRPRWRRATTPLSPSPATPAS